MFNMFSAVPKDANLKRYNRREAVHHISTSQSDENKLNQEHPYLVFIETGNPGVENPGTLISENIVLIPAHLIARDSRCFICFK